LLILLDNTTPVLPVCQIIMGAVPFENGGNSERARFESRLRAAGRGPFFPEITSYSIERIIRFVTPKSVMDSVFSAWNKNVFVSIGE